MRVLPCLWNVGQAVGKNKGKSQTQAVPLGVGNKTWRSDSWLAGYSFALCGCGLGLVSLYAPLASGLAPSSASFLLHGSVRAQYSPFSSRLTRPSLPT